MATVTSYQHTTLTALLVISTLLAGEARAHCDSMDGPVVRDARAALERRDATPVLKWVAAEHESEIRAAFERTLAVRAVSEDAKRLADQFFFETLVRIHRAGEGEAFTGLKPAGSVDPGIAAADQALESGSGGELSGSLSRDVEEGVRKRFEKARRLKERSSDSVAAGREYVAAYVDYVHFVESVHRLAEHGAPHTHDAPAAHAEE
jgi:hypothetical protein